MWSTAGRPEHTEVSFPEYLQHAVVIVTATVQGKLPLGFGGTQRFFPLRWPARLGGNERSGPSDPQRDTDRRACGEVHKAAVTRDHVLLASSGQSDGFIHQGLW